jgi:hypothetical protein
MISVVTEPRRSLFLWLVSLLANVSVYEGSNQMGAKNLGELSLSLSLTSSSSSIYRSLSLF